MDRSRAFRSAAASLVGVICASMTIDEVSYRNFSWLTPSMRESEKLPSHARR